MTTASSCEEYDGEIDNKMSSFLGRLFKGGANKKKKENKHPHLKRNQNPFDIWTNVGELGDGAFGKVYKVPTASFDIYAYYHPKKKICIICNRYIVSL